MIWFFDIDGTVIDNIGAYYQAWYAYAINRKIGWAAYREDQYGVVNIFEPLEPVDIEDFEQSEEFADFYIKKAFPGATKAIHKLVRRGDVVKLLTSRNKDYRIPITKAIRNMFEDTLGPERKTVSLEVLTRRWAEINHINPDDIIFRDDKAAAVSEFAGRCICVEDTPSKIEAFKSVGVTCIIKDAKYNRDVEGLRFKDWSDFMALADATSDFMSKAREAEINKAAEEEERVCQKKPVEDTHEYTEVEKALQAEASAALEENNKLKEEIASLKKDNAVLTRELRQKHNTPIQSFSVVGEVSTDRLATLMSRGYWDPVYELRNPLIFDKIVNRRDPMNTLKNMVGLMGLMSGLELADIVGDTRKTDRSNEGLTKCPKAVEQELIKDREAYDKELHRLHDVFTRNGIQYAFVEDSAGFIKDGEYQVGSSVKVMVPAVNFRLTKKVLSDEYGEEFINSWLAAYRGEGIIVFSGDIRICVYCRYAIEEKLPACNLFGKKIHSIYYIPCCDMREEVNGLYVTTELFDQIVIDKFKELGYSNN